GLPLLMNGTRLNSGSLWANEFVDTTRMDVDLSLSYFFPDVLPRVDASVGTGFKFIYASATRQYFDLSPTAAAFTSPAAGFPAGLYLICHPDVINNQAAQTNCPGPNRTNRPKVHEDSQIYGATFPMTATVNLTSDSKWLLPVTLSPMIGLEHRNDR